MAVHRALLCVLLVLSANAALQAPIEEAYEAPKSWLEKVECKLCRAVMGGVDDLIRQEKSEDEVRDFVVSACIKLKIESEAVCTGAVNNFYKEVLQIITENQLAPDEVCSRVNLCRDANAARARFATTVPEQPAGLRGKIGSLPSSGPSGRLENVDPEDVGVFWHVTDVHVDPLYRVGSDEECGEPLCCREGTGNAGQVGHYKCDLPPSTVLRVFDWMRSELSHPDFILWTGDSPPHDVWLQGRTENMEKIRLVTGLLQNAFPDVTIVPTIGNHGMFPIDQFAPPPLVSWFYEGVADIWKGFLPESTLKDFKYSGYYDWELRPGFRVVATNLMYCDPTNWYASLARNETDPAGQLQWLSGVLQDAETKGDKVLLTGHIPPGKAGDSLIFCNCLDDYSDRYNALADRFASTIVGQIYGHTHYDEFRVVRDSKTGTDARNVIYISPSITTFTGLNPSIRYFKYNKKTFEILDYVQYRMDLDKANKEGKVEFQKQYSALEHFNLRDMSASSWSDAAAAIRTNATMRDNYVKDFTSGGPGECDKACQANRVCAMVSMDQTAWEKCIVEEAGPGIFEHWDQVAPTLI